MRAGTAQPTVTLRVPAIALFPIPVALAVAGLGLLRLAGEKHSAPIGSAGFYLIFLATGILTLTLLVRVQLSPAGVRIKAFGRNRLVGWPEIRAVTMERHRRSRRVTLWTTSGAAVPLPLPLPVGKKAWNEPAFLRGYHLIGQYWLAHRPPDEQLPAGYRPATGQY